MTIIPAISGIFKREPCKYNGNHKKGGFYDHIRPAMGDHAAQGHLDLFADQGLFLQPRNPGLPQTKPEHLHRHTEWFVQYPLLQRGRCSSAYPGQNIKRRFQAQLSRVIKASFFFGRTAQKGRVQPLLCCQYIAGFHHLSPPKFLLFKQNIPHYSAFEKPSFPNLCKRICPPLLFPTEQRRATIKNLSNRSKNGTISK